VRERKPTREDLLGAEREQTEELLDRLANLVEPGRFEKKHFYLAQHVVLKSRWADDLSQQLGAAEGLLWEARRIVSTEPKPKQLAALKRLFGLRYPKKRDLKELARNYIRLTKFKPAEGCLMLRVLTGRRAPTQIPVENCPLEPEAALEVLKDAYEAKTADAILKDLHRAKGQGELLPSLPGRGGR
jgi:hypothetical protein